MARWRDGAIADLLRGAIERTLETRDEFGVTRRRIHAFAVHRLQMRTGFFQPDAEREPLRFRRKRSAGKCERTIRTARERIQQIAFGKARRQIKLPVRVLFARQTHEARHALKQRIAGNGIEKTACTRARQCAALRYSQRPALYHD